MGLTFRGMLSVGLLVPAGAGPPARQTSKTRRGPLDTGSTTVLLDAGQAEAGRRRPVVWSMLRAPATGQASARCVTRLRAADHISRKQSTVACMAATGSRSMTPYVTRHSFPPSVSFRFKLALPTYGHWSRYSQYPHPRTRQHAFLVPPCRPRRRPRAEH